MVALIRNIDIVIAYIFDVFLFHSSFTSISLLGSGLVVIATIGCGIVNVLQKASYKELRCELMSVESEDDKHVLCQID